MANDGTIVQGTQSKDPCGLSGMEFFGGGNITASSLTLGNTGTVSLLYRPFSITGTQYLVANGDGTKRFALASVGSDIRFTYYDGASSYSKSTGSVLTLNKLVLITATWDSSTITIYTDTVSGSGGDSIATNSTNAFTVASLNDGSSKATGRFIGLGVYEDTKDATWVGEAYNKYAKLPIYINDLKDANESIAAEGGTVGTQLSNTDWKFGDTTGRYKISRDSLEGKVGGPEKLVDGDMEAVGVGDWTAVNGTVTKSVDNPHSGTQAVRITGTAGSPFVYPAATTTIVGGRYRVTGWARGDGVSVPIVWDAVEQWTGTASTDWQYFNVTYTATVTKPRFYVGGAGIAHWTEFDDVSVKEIDANEKVIECTTGGLLYTESQQSYGIWEFSLYKATTGTFPIISFITNQLSAFNAAGSNGYLFALNIAEQLECGKFTNGVYGAKAISAPSYITWATWYTIRITRSLANVFSMYIKGGVFKNWTLAVAPSNPFTEPTHTSSKFFVVDIDAGDKFCGLTQLTGVVSPI